MKKIAVTVPALALAGALALNVAPAAHAESAVGSSGSSAAAGSSGAAGGAGEAENLPPLNQWEVGAVAGTLEGAEWFYHAAGKHVVDNRENVNTDVTTLTGGFMTIEAFAQAAGYAAPDSGSQQVGSSAGSSAAADAARDLLPFASVGGLAGELGGQQWFYNRDINFVVNSRDLVNQTVAEGQAGVMLTLDFARQLGRSLPINVVLAQGSSLPGSSINVENAVEREARTGQAASGGSSVETLGGAASDVVGGSSNGGGVEASVEIERLALIALPAVLLLGGIYYYLNNDGRTYVTSSARTSSTPTAQERASSENLLSSNRNEVQRQALEVTPTAEQARGISAETGVNGVAKGLIGLLIAVVLGAAAFHFGRKQLV